MPIVPDGGLWNENISELQRALNALGADPPLPETGSISNTTIHRLQSAANALGADPPLAEDGGLGNDAIRELQMAVAALQQSVPLPVEPVDPGAPYVDLNMRELDGATFDFGSAFHTEASVATPNGGSITLALTGAAEGEFDIAFDDDSDDVQASLDAEFGPGVVIVLGSGGSTLADGTDFYFYGPTTGITEATLEDNALTGGTAVVVVADHGPVMTVWPDVQNHVDAIIDVNDGSTNEAGFILSEDAHGTVLTGFYDTFDDSVGDSRMTCPVDLTDPIFADGWTVYSLRKVGDDAPDDESELCPDTFGPDDEVYYNDVYVDGEIPEDSVFYPALTNEYQYGGPQRGDVYLWVHSLDAEDSGFSHIDGPALQVQTTRRSGLGLLGALAGGVMLANYPGGGYCLPGPYVRFLVYPTAHSEAERLWVRRMLRDENAGTDYAFTLRDEVPVVFTLDLYFDDVATFADAGSFDVAVDGDSATIEWDDTTTTVEAALRTLFGTDNVASVVFTLDADPPFSTDNELQTRVTVTFVNNLDPGEITIENVTLMADSNPVNVLAGVSS